MSIKEAQRAKRAIERAEAAAEITVTNLSNNEGEQPVNTETLENAAVVVVEPAAISLEELQALQEEVESSTRNSVIIGNPEAVVERSQLRTKESDVVIVTGQRNYGKINVVFAALDKFNPDFIVIGESGRADQMAMAWAKSRGVQFRVVTADWDTLGNSAGPVRNGEALDLVRKIMIERQKSATHLFFDNPEFGQDRAVNSMYQTANARNELMKQRQATLPYVIPTIDAETWLDNDLAASAAKAKVVGLPDADFPDTIMIGARRLPNPDEVRTGVVLSTEPPY